MLRVHDGSLYFGGELLSDSQGGAGLHVRGRALYYNDDLLVDGDVENGTGLVVAGESLLFDGNPVTGGEPDSEYSPEGYWLPPPQPANVEGRNWTYAQIIAKYDALVAVEPRFTKHRYEVGGTPVLTVNGGHELYHYLYEPPGYDKTIFMQAQIHGNEKDSRLTLYRMMEILFTMRDTPGYTAWKRVYDRCRLIVIPVVSPHGNETGSMNIPYPGAEHGINMNRNYDYNHQYFLPSPGVGGNAPWDMAEVRHSRDVVLKYGPQNIDLAIDYHDGGNVSQHYWIDYVVDAPNGPLVNAFVDYLMHKYGVDPEDAVIPNVKDTEITGATSRWFGRSMGVTASTNEWMGGIFGYTFDSAQMTHSLDIRSNMLFIALDNDIKGWEVREPVGAEFFHFDYPKAFTVADKRLPGPHPETLVSDAAIYTRWDALRAANPALIVKSAALGQNAHGMDVHTYTFGSGSKKVLFVGGVMRFGATRRIDEYAAHHLIEYLCDDYIVSQSAFLTDLRDNYTVIVLPFIDNLAGNSNATQREAGLNNTVIARQRWVIDANDKTVPAANEHGAGNHGVQIIKALIDANTDLECIVSGGEWMGGYANPPDYVTEFQTHIVVPRNMTFDRGDYAAHLTSNRSEHVAVENTQGFTFGDYAFDQHGIPTYFVQLQVSDRFTDLAEHHTLSVDQYLHSNYEAGRRMANIANLFLGAG